MKIKFWHFWTHFLTFLNVTDIFMQHDFYHEAIIAIEHALLYIQICNYTVVPKRDVPKNDAFLIFSRNSAEIRAWKWRIFGNFAELKMRHFLARKCMLYKLCDFYHTIYYIIYITILHISYYIRAYCIGLVMHKKHKWRPICESCEH